MLLNTFGLLWDEHEYRAYKGFQHSRVVQEVSFLPWLCALLGCLATLCIFGYGVKLLNKYRDSSVDRCFGRVPSYLRQQNSRVYADLVENDSVAGSVQVVAPVYLWLALFTSRSWRSWRVSGRRRSSDRASMIDRAISIGSCICSGSRSVVMFLDECSNLLVVGLGVCISVRWTFDHVVQADLERSNFVRLSFYLALREVNNSWWWFSKQMGSILGNVLIGIERLLFVWYLWYFPVVLPFLWLRLRTFVRKLTIRKLSALAVVAAVCVVSSVVSSLAVTNPCGIPQLLPEAQFYEIPFGLEVDEFGCVSRGPVSIGKVRFAAFAEDWLESVLRPTQRRNVRTRRTTNRSTSRRTSGFSSCKCGCESEGLCSDFKSRSQGKDTSSGIPRSPDPVIGRSCCGFAGDCIHVWIFGSFL